MNVLQMFSYPFMQRALAAGVLVSLCAALLGVPLVLKRYSMIGDGLSHVSFGALAIAVALGVTPLYFSIPVVILAAFFLLRMASHPHWNSDAAIAAVSASALAVGILVISRTTGMTTDVDNYMFGSVLAMTKGDVKHVIEALVEEIQGNLANGDKVKLNQLGTFHMTFRCPGMEASDKCTVRNISKVNIRFIPDKELKLVNGSTAVTRSPANVGFVLDKPEEGGSGGGQLVACGTPEQIAACPESFTGQYLKKMLK